MRFIYNMDFLISALVFLSLLLFHFYNQKKLDNIRSRIFQTFIFVGIFDIIFDILCTLLISAENPEYVGITELTLILLYLMQLFVPYIYLCYVKSLRVDSERQTKRIIRVWMIPTAVMAVLVLTNPLTGQFFCFDDAGVYCRGPLYLWMYGFAIVYVVIAAVDSIVFYKKLGRRKFITIWEFLIIATVSVMVQAVNNDLLMTGFGISLGITVLYLTLHNPYGYTDSLTGTFDKLYFERWIHEQIDKRKKLNLIAVDVQRIKNVNKMLGASTGDQILVKISKKLQQLSDSKQVFRITGKRFLLVTNSLDEYERCRNEIRSHFGQTFNLQGEEFRLPAVVCGVLHGEELKESDTILAYLEYLISIVPESDESTLIQGDERTMEGFHYEQEIQHYLNVAIEKDLFEVYFQPVYSLEKGGYVTLEALSRLRHPSFGMVSPEVFISIAEKNGQISQIGYQQFRRICKFVKENQILLEKIQNIKVNLSPLELLKPGQGHALIELIREYELPYSFFQFEITETVASEYSEHLREAVAEFLEVGIGLCLDDFGSGYANLNAVLKLPFSSIKLDRSLLVGICEEKQISVFYHSIVALFQNMGYQVIAEGVEKESEVELLRTWGVDMIQGYYFSKPVNGKEIIEKVCEI